MSRSAGTAVDFLPFAKLTQVNLAPRVRSLLEGAYQTTWPTVDAALERALDDLDRDLFKHAERAPNVNEQNRCFESLREFRRRRADFVLACRDATQRSVLALVDPKIASDTHVGRVRAKPELSLVDPAEFEEEMALSEIAAKAEIRASNALQALAYRLGVIAGSPPIELEQLALGPHAICAAIRIGARKFDVILAHRVALYRQIDRTLFMDPVGLYEAVNRYLIEHRVFAHLHLAPRKAAVAAPATPAAAPAAEHQEQDPAAATPAPATPAPAAPPAAPAPSTPTAEAAPAAQAFAPEAQESPAARAFQQLIDANAQEQVRAAQSVASSSNAAESALDAQFFTTLRELLAGRRHATHSADPAESQRPVAQTQDLQAVLTVLQAQPASPVMVGGKWVNRGVGHIKQDVMNQLRSLSDGGLPKLREEDSDTIDLVGFLFDHLLSDYRPNSMSHGLMSRLQVPLLKVALKDKSFFTRRNHPARQLLNSIAETSAYWVEDEDADRPVIEKMQMVVDRVIKEFDDDVGVFDRLFDDLSKHIGSLQKKAEVSERRHVEAAKGREKLDLARAAAQEAVQQRMFDHEPPAAVKALLENAWTDAIALSLLRQGIDNPKTRARLNLVDELVAAFAPGKSSTQQRQALDDLRGPLEEGLSAIGFHEDTIAKAWNDISGLVEIRHEQAQQAATHAITELIKTKPRLGEEARVAANSNEPAAQASSSILQSLRKTERIPVGPKEQGMVDRIKQLPFGTWFEFTLNQQGETTRRKLCWFSPVTGRCLFVNARGAKGEERMIDQLARDMLRGNARVVEEARDNLIDRAWKGIMSMVKGVGRGGRETAEQPA